jgi:GTPase SAR1 family protein
MMEMRHRPMVAAATSASQNDSFFNTSFRDIARKLNACNETLGQLQQLGVSHDVSLPELVLVGDQSSGKSTLMSGLAGINLPRSDGVCTRCPIHIRASPSRDGNWSCRISLQRDYNFLPPADRPITVADVTAANPFPPWSKQSREVNDFMTINEKDDLESAIRWAQIAILNHNKNCELFIPGSAYTREVGLEKALQAVEADFSPNTVALEIRGPGLPDLSFYDMPGIFRLHNQESKSYLVEVVKNLAREYISHPRAILICAVPMTVDPELSETFKMIRELDATHRTIGVLTKADILLQSGALRQSEGNAIERWLEMLRGNTWQTGLGYFMTSRQPGKTLEELREWEDYFFTQDGEYGWPQDLSAYADQLGIERLKTFLSEKLGEEFAKR